MEVVDGQQRIVTVMLIYAVLRYRLTKIIKEEQQKEIKNLSGAQLSEVQVCLNNLESRLFYKDSGIKNKLIVGWKDLRAQQGQNTEFISPESISFESLQYLFSRPPATAGKANSDDEGPGKTWERNAREINTWFNKTFILRQNSTAQTVFETAKGLIAFADALDNNTVWTTSLTTHASLARQTFANCNNTGNRAELKLPDVLKVMFVSKIADDEVKGLESQRCAAVHRMGPQRLTIAHNDCR